MFVLSYHLDHRSCLHSINRSEIRLAVSVPRLEHFLYSLPLSGSYQPLLLATVFALNFHYQPVDLVVVCKSGILEILSLLTDNTCVLMNQRWLAASVSGSMLLNGAVKLACARLLQILAIAAR